MFILMTRSVRRFVVPMSLKKFYSRFQTKDYECKVNLSVFYLLYLQCLCNVYSFTTYDSCFIRPSTFCSLFTHIKINPTTMFRSDSRTENSFVVLLHSLDRYVYRSLSRKVRLTFRSRTFSVTFPRLRSHGPYKFLVTFSVTRTAPRLFLYTLFSTSVFQYPSFRMLRNVGCHS